MINKKASIRFTDKSHLIMDNLVNISNKSVSSIINDLIENIDINIYRPDHKEQEIQTYTRFLNLIEMVPDDGLKNEFYKEVEAFQCRLLR